MTVNKSCIYRQLSILVLVTAFAFSAMSQQLMLKNFRADRPTMMFSSVVPEENSYVVSGVTSNLAPPYYGRNLIGRLNLQGEFTVVSYVYDTVGKNYGNFSNSLIKCSNGRYACAGYSVDSIPRVMFSLYSENMDSIWVEEYDSSNSYSYQGLFALQQEECFYVVGGRTDKNVANPDLTFMKIGSTGNKIWLRLYGSLPMAESATSFNALSSGNLMIGSYRRDYIVPIESANTWLLEVDTAGAIVRQWFDPSDSTMGAYGLRQTNDGGFIYAAQTIHTQSINGPYFIGSVVKMDSNFNIQWKWTGGYPRVETGLFDIEELNDGSFVACGNDPYVNGTVMTGAWVVKLSPGGELLWQRHYSGSDAMDTENYLNDIDVLPNGNLVAVGETRDFTDVSRGQMGLLLVMDSNGCVIENCTVGIDDLESKAQMKVYPNPFTDEISISLENTILNNATITVTNQLGQVLYQVSDISLSDNYTINLNTLPEGLYFISIEADGERIVQQVVKQ